VTSSDHDGLNPSEDLQDLYENAPCGYLSVRPDARIVKVNRTFSTWTGFEPDELVGKRLHDLLNMAGKIFFETHFAPLLRMQGFFNEVALDIVKKDGGRFPVLVNATERKDDAGNPLFIRLTVFNATDRRRYERELVRAREELRELNLGLEKRVAEAVAEQLKSNIDLSAQREEAVLREQFIAVLGHDLRNPLASIAAGTRLLVKHVDDEKANTILTMMQKSVGRMSGLIDNILDFARGRLGGGLSITRSDQPLEPALQQVVDELQSTHPEQKIDVTMQIRVPVYADPLRVSQLLSNLLANALTYGAEGEPIRVRASTNDEFCLSVANSGKPIPPAAMDRLFHPFSRGEVRPSQQGLGLGLYIASEIARAHRGKLEVSSNEAETCFTFRMPLSPAA
jgi:sigma-B regulation protein RsbU (phosphoserine phosphatase)